MREAARQAPENDPRTWLKMPSVTLMMVLLLAFLFYHMALGLQVVIENYVHSAAKIPALVLLHLSCFALAAVGILAALHVAFTG